MNVERVFELLRELTREGMRVRVEPESVFLLVGKLEVACPYTPGTLRPSHTKTRIILDGHEFQSRLSAIDVRLAVGEVNTATLTLGIVP